MANKNKIEIILSAVDKGLRAGFNRALVSLKSFVTGAGKAKSGVLGLDTSFAGLATRLTSFLSIVAGLKKLTTVSRQFDKISAGLLTATKSAEGSEEAFGAIQDFATDTPYDLAQVSESFVKLVNYGLTPSERALSSYGNTSSALGKELNQMIEAVADAATGEFERLKEFGIKASSQGDKVKFTFRGVTTTVGKNAKEIEDYLIKLGETNFGDSMANRMETVDGALSNLGDEWDKVFLNLSRNGIGDIIETSVRAAISALGELNAMISSGELELYLASIAGQFSGWADDIKASIDIIKKKYDSSMQSIEDGGNATVQFLVNAFRRFPENVRAFVGIMTVEVAAGFDKAKAKARLFKNSIAAIFTSETMEGVGDQYEREMEIIDAARLESIDAILEEREATIEASTQNIEEARKRREAYEEEQTVVKESTEDRLAKYKIEAEASETATEMTDKEADALKKLAAAKMRAASQEKILALERQKIAASSLPSELERAEAELDIDRQIMEERVNLKRQELATIQADKDASQTDIINAESDLAETIVNNEIAINDRLRDLSSQRMKDLEEKWRSGIVPVEEYQAAVEEALESGAITQEEANERMIASSNDLSDALALGMQKARESMQTDAEMMINIGENLSHQIADNLVSEWDAYVSGTKSAKEAFADFAQSTIKWLAQIILKQMILKALQSFGFSSGGEVAGAYASGGSVTGWSPSPTADNIPAWLTAGEFVHPVKAVDYYGVGFMESVRRMRFPRNVAHAMAGGTLPRIPSGYRLAQGGVAAGGGSTTVKAGDTKLRVVNVLDKNMMGDYMRTADGETALINVIRRNGSTIRALIGG